MITLDCEQGSQAWQDARLGCITASQFGRIVTPTGRLSAQRDGYLAELLCEYALGYPVVEFDTQWLERGRILEPDAVAYYSVHTDIDPEKVGFIWRDETRLVGGSPDALVGDDGLLEIKCPMVQNHLLWLIRGECPKAHWPQLQGQLYVTGRSHVDFMSYAPELPPLIVRVKPDEKYQAALAAHIPTFVAELLEGREKLRAWGITPEES